MPPPLLLVLRALAAGHQNPTSQGSSALSEWRPAKASYYAADHEDAVGTHQKARLLHSSVVCTQEYVHRLYAPNEKFYGTVLAVRYFPISVREARWKISLFVCPQTARWVTGIVCLYSLRISWMCRNVSDQCSAVRRADGACGFGDLGKHGYGTATVGLSSALFERGAACGGCYEVKCVEDLKYCLPGTSIVVTATNFCAPNYGLPADAGGHCNPPNHHFLLPIQAFEKIALWKAGVMPIQYRRYVTFVLHPTFDTRSEVIFFLFTLCESVCWARIVLVSATWKPTKAELHVTVGEERVEVEVGPLLSFINFVSSFYMSFLCWILVRIKKYGASELLVATGNTFKSTIWWLCFWFRSVKSPGWIRTQIAAFTNHHSISSSPLLSS
jgi:hypothetical protein